MKIAAFNVENLFDRARAFNEEAGVASRVLEQAAELNALFEKPSYSDTDKAEMVRLLGELDLGRSDTGDFVLLRRIRGRIVRRPRDGSPMEIVADGRDDWVGWIEARTEPVNEIAIDNTGRVIRDVGADVLAVIEAENRTLLEQFSTIVLHKVGGRPYDEVMLLDGNDRRGIDVGVMATNGFRIGAMVTHIYDRGADGGTIFSRDCPEYEILTPAGTRVWVLPNHFKSKYGGNDAASQARRRAQAARTAELYEALIARGESNVVVLGDLNDTPDSAPLRPLLADTDLRDVSEHPSFDTGAFEGIGTYGLGNDNQKIDYLLLSPALFDKVRASGLFRKGAWPGSRPVRWEVYPELTRKVHVASDHHVIWADIDI